VIGSRHDHILDGVGVGFGKQGVAAKQSGTIADIFIVWPRPAIAVLRLVDHFMPKRSEGDEIGPSGKIRKFAEPFEQACDMVSAMVGPVTFGVGGIEHVPSSGLCLPSRGRQYLPMTSRFTFPRRCQMLADI
jgi:hypothetical protein